MSILDEAAALVNVDRQAEYGDPLTHFSDVAVMWTVILGHAVKPREVALCMAALKIAREAHKPKRDNRIDGAAYLELADRLTEA